jgi:hypothetical protein
MTNSAFKFEDKSGYGNVVVVQGGKMLLLYCIFGNVIPLNVMLH